VPKLSVTVITKNEAANIADALASAAWAMKSSSSTRRAPTKR
jgi:glycosyltransferase involved in cell wall biosynthesis